MGKIVDTYYQIDQIILKILCKVIHDFEDLKSKTLTNNENSRVNPKIKGQ